MSASFGFAADDVPHFLHSAQVGGPPPSYQADHDAWSPLVVAAMWWGFVGYACARALIGW